MELKDLQTLSHRFFSPPVPPAITPVLTPSLGGFLTPLSASVMPVTSASVQVCNVVVGIASCSAVSPLSEGHLKLLFFHYGNNLSFWSVRDES